MVRIEDLTDNDVAFICERAAAYIIFNLGFVLIEPNDYDEYEVPDSVERLFIGEDFELNIDLDHDFELSDTEWEVIFNDIRRKHEEFCEDAAKEILYSNIFYEATSNAREAADRSSSIEVSTAFYGGFLVYDLDSEIIPSSYDWKVIIEHMQRFLKKDPFTYRINYESGNMKIHYKW